MCSLLDTRLELETAWYATGVLVIARTIAELCALTGSDHCSGQMPDCSNRGSIAAE